MKIGRMNETTSWNKRTDIKGHQGTSRNYHIEERTAATIELDREFHFIVPQTPSQTPTYLIDFILAFQQLPPISQPPIPSSPRLISTCKHDTTHDDKPLYPQPHNNNHPRRWWRRQISPNTPPRKIAMDIRL